MSDWRSYDGVAEAYERVHAPRMAEPARDLVGLAVQAGTAARVLDVGTGTGVTAAAAEATAPDGLVVGVDASGGMLAVASRVRPGLRLAAAEAINLPFRDATFDVVTSSFVITHFARYETALFDMVRVLRPGGRLAVSTWGDGTDDLQTTWRSLVEGVVPREMLTGALGQAIPWEERFADPARLEQALRNAGLRSVRVVRREYRFRYTIDEYLAGRETSASGRLAKDMLGEPGWASFRERAHTAFAKRFADPLNDFRDVLIAVATKPT